MTISTLNGSACKGVDTFGECPISQVGDEFYDLWVNETGGLPKTLRLKGKMDTTLAQTCGGVWGLKRGWKGDQGRHYLTRMCIWIIMKYL